jgi:4-amino-4-deoxychorismate lyase
MEPRVLAVLGRGVIPLDTPLLRADDLGATRGDGAFETMHVRAASAWLLDAHLSRMEESARRLDLALPPAAALADLVTTALAAWPADREGGIKLVATRGADEDGAAPSVYALVFPVGPGALKQRREGLRVISAPLGLSADARAAAPWLLGGVKSLSYATNMAALRWAAGQGLDDVVFLASDGQVLEGPTSTVVWATGGTLCTVPDETGILPGITAAYLLDHAGELGLATDRRSATLDDLIAADGVWFCSSVRGVAPVTDLDGKPIPDPGLTGHLRDLLGFPA